MISAKEKEDLIDWIKNLENQSLLQHFLDLKNSNESDFLYLVSDQERIAIKGGIDSLENEGGISHEDVKKMTREKFPNLFKD